MCPTNYRKEIKERGPFELIYYEACLNEQDGAAREKYLKLGMGKRYLKNRLRRFLSLTGWMEEPQVPYKSSRGFKGRKGQWAFLQNSVRAVFILDFRLTLYKLEIPLCPMLYALRSAFFTDTNHGHGHVLLRGNHASDCISWRFKGCPERRCEYLRYALCALLFYGHATRGTDTFLTG